MGEKGVRERLLGEINNNQRVSFHTARFSGAVSSTILVILKELTIKGNPRTPRRRVFNVHRRSPVGQCSGSSLN